jgi:hypothetical protein
LEPLGRALIVAAKYGHMDIVRFLFRKYDGLRKYTVNDFTIQYWNDDIADSLLPFASLVERRSEVLDSTYVPIDPDNRVSLKFPLAALTNKIRDRQWKVYSLLEPYFMPEKEEYAASRHRVKKIIEVAVQTNDWRFVEALLRRPFNPNDYGLWNVFTGEAVKQNNPDMLNKIINYMRVYKGFSETKIESILEFNTS